jgi:hypothetical protein
MHKNFSLLFYLKKPKSYTTGNAPIYLRITVEGQRAEVSTQRQCDPERWNSQSGRMAGTKEDARIMNIYFDTLQTKMYELHREVLLSGLPITAEAIKNKFTGCDERPRMLVEIYKQHNQQFAELGGYLCCQRRKRL